MSQDTLVVFAPRLTAAEALAALFNASKAQGMGFVQPWTAQMRVDEAEELLKEDTSFDYVRGRVLKIDLELGAVDTRLFDRDNGQGRGRQAIEEAIAAKEVKEVTR